MAAYSVGQQIAIGALTFGIGFTALVFIFRVRSFKEVIARGREDRASEKGEPTQTPTAGSEPAVDGPAARSRSPRAPRARE